MVRGGCRYLFTGFADTFDDSDVREQLFPTSADGGRALAACDTLPRQLRQDCHPRTGTPYWHGTASTCAARSPAADSAL